MTSGCSRLSSFSSSFFVGFCTWQSITSTSYCFSSNTAAKYPMPSGMKPDSGAPVVWGGFTRVICAFTAGLLKSLVKEKTDEGNYYVFCITVKNGNLFNSLMLLLKKSSPRGYVHAKTELFLNLQNTNILETWMDLIQKWLVLVPRRN